MLCENVLRVAFEQGEHMRRLAGLCLALALVAAACGGSDSDPSTDGSTQTTSAAETATTSPAAPTTTAAATTTAAPTTTTAAPTPTTVAPTTTTSAPVPTALWATNGSDSKVFKIDPVGGEILLEIDVEASPAGVALGAGSAWVAISGADYLLRLNAETGEEEARIVVGAGPAGVTFSEELTWVSRFEGPIAVVDPSTNEIVEVIDVGAGATGMAAGSAWVTTWTGRALVRIDADLSTPQRSIEITSVPLDGEGSSPAVGGDFVGATLFNLGQFSVFDRDTLDPIATFDTGNNANVATYGFGAFWVTNSTTGDVYRIDPVAGTAEIVTTVPGALGITVGADMVYVASFSRGVVYQFPPDDPSAMNDLADTGSSAFELAYGTAE